LEEHSFDARINDPRVLSAATAVSYRRVKQQDTEESARWLFARKFRNLDRLFPTFDDGQIETRHFCRSLEWFGREWPFSERDTLYAEHTLKFSEQALSELALLGVSALRLEMGDH